MLWQLFGLIAIGLFVLLAFVLLAGVVCSQASSDAAGGRLWGPLRMGGLLWGVIVVVGTPLVYTAFRHQILSFGEDLNAVVVAVRMEPTMCSEDGRCLWTYQCHPYLVNEDTYVPDANGHLKKVSKPVPKYHQCPYVQQEQTWITLTSLKEDPQRQDSDNVTFTEAQHRLPENPQFHQWIEHQVIPISILEAAGVGEPPISQYYQRILNEGQYPAISVKQDFDNFLLSDPDTTLRPSVSQSELAPYQKAGLLPKLTITPDEKRSLGKVYFVGMKPPQNVVNHWQIALSHFNAEAGALRQMDLHLVILPDAVGDVHQYALALRGYWSDTSVFGKDTLPKNTVVAILTTSDGRSVKRAEAFTLMPPAADGVSNTLLFQDIQSQVPGSRLEPEVLLGDPLPIVRKVNDARYDVTYQAGALGRGLLEQLLVTGPNHFQRVPMASFRYLEDEILPSTGECVWIAMIVAGLGLIACGAVTTILSRIADS